MIRKIITVIKERRAEKNRLDSLLRLAKAEYRKDWEYAYIMLKSGKEPFAEA